MGPSLILAHQLLLLHVLLVPSLGCDGRANVEHRTFPEGGMLADAVPVPQVSLPALRGIFTTDGELRRFGDLVSVHSTASGVSLFGDEDARYALLDAGCLEDGSRLVLEGEHRVAVDVDTGLLRFEVEPPSLAAALCRGDADASDPGLHPGARLSGVYGEGDDLPDLPAGASFTGPLVPIDDFTVASHRGGCRTIDDCGVSENSIEAVVSAERFGATSVEIDVRFTRDGVPVLYHDAKLSSRLTRGRYCVGEIANLDLAHLQANCRLRFGEAMPTLEEALDAALGQTNLRAVWLDVKSDQDVPTLVEITRRINARAEALGRSFRVFIGCPSQAVYDAFVALGPPDVPCLVELSLDDVIAAGCEIWGPRYTLGPMAEEVARARAAGIRTVFWTVNGQEFIDLLLTDSDPAGLLTDRPHLVFHRDQMLRGGYE
ncbi:MAG: hypothetical protein DRJ42_26325 [Deltaproteobacteria bacterium]|nr:MAG: hypothetical protein DRJ42_26325 [Deltaproteobacteria bacterium]